MSQQSPETPSSIPVNSQNAPVPEQPKVNVQAEIQQIRRIVNGANRRLERLCDSIGPEPVKPK